MGINDFKILLIPFFKVKINYKKHYMNKKTIAYIRKLLELLPIFENL